MNTIPIFAKFIFANMKMAEFFDAQFKKFCSFDWSRKSVQIEKCAFNSSKGVLVGRECVRGLACRLGKVSHLPSGTVAERTG